jgi:hypothetical protein
MIETKDSDNPQTLLGRTIHMGNFWSVVCRVDDNKLHVWGNVAERIADSSGLEILSDYQLQK